MRIPLLTTLIFLIMSAIACAERVESCSDIVRYDERNSRIFVVCPNLGDMDADQIGELVTKVFARFDGPPDEYFISFFAQKEMVGYKTDSELQDFVMSGAWAVAYLGEYYTHSHQITLWPANPEKRLILQLPPS